MRKWVLGAVMGGALALLPATWAAGAGYPPATTSTTVAPGTASNSVTLGVGSNQLINAGCEYNPNSDVSLAINGVNNQSTTSNGTGCVTFMLSVTDPHISINGATPVAVNFGTSNVTASGTGNNGAPFVFTLSVLIPNTSTSANSATSSGSGASGSSSGLAFTGADVAATVAGGVLLLGLGTAMVLLTRRRSGRHTSA